MSFHKKYIKGGVKRKLDEVVVPSSQPDYWNKPSKKRKLYEISDSSPLWTMPFAVGEKKGMDTNVAPLSIVNTTSSNSNIDCLNLVQAGTGSWNRIGRKIKLRSLRVKGNITNLYTRSNGDLIGNTVRLLVVWDKQPSGGPIPNFDTMFGVTDQQGAETSDYFSPPSYKTMDRFRVLKEINMDFCPGVLPGADNDTLLDIKDVDFYLKLGNLETVYQNTSNPSTIGDINSGALYLILRAARNSGTTSQATANLDCRLRFLDP